MSFVILCSIFRNEERVVSRALRSAHGIIDAWVVSDTGSEDMTPAIVSAELASLPGVLRHDPWQNFAVNRTIVFDAALELARELGHEHDAYGFILDADDVVEVPEGWTWPNLEADFYEVEVHHSGMVQFRGHLFKLSRGWCYRNAVHNVAALKSGGSATIGRVPELVYRCICDGHRSLDRPARFRADAAALDQQLALEPENTRAAFYLAQSYRDALMLEESLRVYEMRAQMGGWVEEVFVALLEAAKIRARLGHPKADVWAAYMRAWAFRPSRAEALLGISVHARSTGDFAVAYMAARTASEIPPSSDRLFLDGSVPWRARDELAVAAYRTGRFAECAQLCEDLLRDPITPHKHLDRIAGNLAHARARISS